jgi:hypothetical protein
MICTEVRAVMEQSQMPQNMSLGTNGLDPVRWLQKKSDATSLDELVH